MFPPSSVFIYNVLLSSVEQHSSISKQNSFQTGSNLSFSCDGETRVPLWLQSSEDMEKCSKGRVTRNLCFFLSKPLLLDYTGLVFRPQMNLYPPPSLVYIPCHILLMKSALVINKRHFPLEFYVFPWVCVQIGFLFCSLSTDAWFPYGLLNHRIQGWGLHSSLYFFKCQKCIWCTSKNLNHCSRGEWVNQMEIPTKRVFSTLAAR